MKIKKLTESNHRRLREAVENETVKILDKYFDDNWKVHANASVPRSNPAKINVYDFNKDYYEPLRPKYYETEIQGNNLFVDWVCQEEFDDIDGMEREFKRWANYIVKHHVENPQLTSVEVYVHDRDGYAETEFDFTIGR